MNYLTQTMSLLKTVLFSKFAKLEGLRSLLNSSKLRYVLYNLPYLRRRLTLDNCQKGRVQDPRLHPRPQQL